ncbi:TniQ family protein [Thalassospira povalilytica]|uniref:TniQ family protein n=1 Tax=Thalassospira povalilytica TaxID=732237 RepID=A0A8I1SIW9_9PROT|nr:TniQ family protein [Thalassospira povalilytica]MBN8196030.1 TniQ family protein [Thalassospira povalilytica]
MTSSKTLLFQSPPIKHESLIGYLIRVAELNRYPRMSWIGNLAGVSLTDQAQSKIADKLGKLSKIIGVAEDEMKSLSFYTSARGNNSHVILSTGEIIPRQFLYWPSERVCFSCLREKSFVSGLWDLKFVTHCPEHGELLRNTCPSCGEDVVSNRGRVVPCLPGCQFKAAANECSSPVKALMQLISNKFMGTQFDVSAQRLPAQLVDGDLYFLLRTISFLSTRLWHENEDLDEKWHEETSDIVVSNVERVAAALANWPHGFCDFVDDVCAGKGAPNGMIVMHQMFGSFYKALVSQRTQLGFLFDALQDYMNNRLSAGYMSARGSPAVFKVRDRRAFMPGFVARKQLGVGKQEFKRLVERKYLQSRVFDTNYGRMICVHRESVKEYGETRSRLVDRKQLADELGVSQHVLYCLNAANILTPIHSPDGDGWPKWFYDRKVVDAWMTDLKAGANRSPKVKKTLRLGQAVAKFNNQGLSYSKLLTAINQGLLKLYVLRKDEETGLQALHVDEAQLENWYSNVH